MKIPKREIKKEKMIDYIERQIENECTTLCLDDPDDRRRMAEWIWNLVK